MLYFGFIAVTIDFYKSIKSIYLTMLSNSYHRTKKWVWSLMILRMSEYFLDPSVAAVVARMKNDDLNMLRSFELLSHIYDNSRSLIMH